MTRLTIIFILFPLTNVFACWCGTSTLTILQKESVLNSKLIFVGDVVEFNSTTGEYTLRVVEKFKGVTESNLIRGKSISNCSGFPKEGRWLIYADSYENGLIDFSMCGLSRPFDNPQYILVREYTIPPPPKKAIYDSIQVQTTLTRIKRQAFLDLELEIEELRKENQ